MVDGSRICVSQASTMPQIRSLNFWTLAWPEESFIEKTTSGTAVRPEGKKNPTRVPSSELAQQWWEQRRRCWWWEWLCRLVIFAVMFSTSRCTVRKSRSKSYWLINFFPFIIGQYFYGPTNKSHSTSNLIFQKCHNIFCQNYPSTPTRCSSKRSSSVGSHPWMTHIEWPTVIHGYLKIREERLQIWNNIEAAHERRQSHCGILLQGPKTVEKIRFKKLLKFKILLEVEAFASTTLRYIHVQHCTLSGGV